MSPAAISDEEQEIIMSQKSITKGCPFCGARPGGIQIEWSSRKRIFCACAFCGACGPTRMTPQDAVRAWERRAE